MGNERGKEKSLWVVVGWGSLWRDDQQDVSSAQGSQGQLTKESLAFNF